jgi:antitoxin component YwqK of YwqJK toxin-antitoxin module
VIDGKINEKYKSYYTNGKLWVICNYIDGKINGEYKEYYYNGQLYDIYNYVDGKINGEYKKYSEDCILINHKLYENNIIIQTIL